MEPKGGKEPVFDSLQNGYKADGRPMYEIGLGALPPPELTA